MFEGIKGFREASLLDWDGKVSAVLFVGSCNFRCPFCHNFPLVVGEVDDYNSEVIKSFLEKNRDFLDGVVLTGGEPTLHPHMRDICAYLRGLGLNIKLDTNGSTEFDFGMVDYVAMDVKSSLENYEKACGVGVDLKIIRENIAKIMREVDDYEFRTTVVPGIVDVDEIESIALSIEGAKKFVIQQFRNEHVLDERFGGVEPYSSEKLLKMKEIAEEHVDRVVIRGLRDVS